MELRIPSFLILLLCAFFIPKSHSQDIMEEEQHESITTIKAFTPFNASQDAEALFNHMRRDLLGPDAEFITQLLTKRSYGQRFKIMKTYHRRFNENFIKDLKWAVKDELLRDVIYALMKPHSTLLTSTLHKVLSQSVIEKDILTELICTADPADIKLINTYYLKIYNQKLVDQISSIVEDGDYKDFLIKLLTTPRMVNVDPEQAMKIAQFIYQTVEGLLGPNQEQIFMNVLTHHSFAQLTLIFDTFANISGESFEGAVAKAGLNEDLKSAVLLTVQKVRNTLPTFFAKKLNGALIKMLEDGNVGIPKRDYETLLRIIVSRSEIDLGQIKNVYKELYSTTLESDLLKLKRGNGSVADNTKALISVLKGN